MNWSPPLFLALRCHSRPSGRWAARGRETRPVWIPFPRRPGLNPGRLAGDDKMIPRQKCFTTNATKLFSREPEMITKHLRASFLGAAFAAMLNASYGAHAQPVAMDSDDIAGVVTGA